MVRLMGLPKIQFPVAAVDDDEPDAPEEHAPPSSAAPSQPPVATTAVPELTHPGESQTNGLAERSVRTLEEQTRAFVVALEAHIKFKIPSTHPLLAWAIEHASFVLNKYMLGRDGRTAYGRLHGKESRDHLCEFGNKFFGSCQPNSGRSSTKRGDMESSLEDP